MKKQKRFSITEWVTYIVVWLILTALFLVLGIPMVRGQLPVSDSLIITEVALLFLSSAIVYHTFKKKDKDKSSFGGGISM